MKSIDRSYISAAGLALALLASAARAEIAAVPAGSLYIVGDSTLHVWRSTATEVAMTFRTADGAPASLADAIKESKVKGMDVRIPLAGLRSGEKGLDKNMRAALEADKFPDIEYKLVRYELAKSGDGAAAKAEGELTIHGRTKPVKIDVELRFRPDGVELVGAHDLLMSDYGVKPPTLMFGTIKVKDSVAVRFDLLLKQDAKRDAPKAQTD